MMTTCRIIPTKVTEQLRSICTELIRFSSPLENYQSYGISFSKVVFVLFMDQPDKVANLAGQMHNKKKKSLSSLAPETLVPRYGFGRPVPRQPGYSLLSGGTWGLYSRDSLRRFPRQRPHNIYLVYKRRSTPVAQSAPRNLLTRWDVSSIPANGIFLTKN